MSSIHLLREAKTLYLPFFTEIMQTFHENYEIWHGQSLYRGVQKAKTIKTQ